MIAYVNMPINNLIGNLGDVCLEILEMPNDDASAGIVSKFYLKLRCVGIYKSRFRTAAESPKNTFC